MRKIEYFKKGFYDKNSGEEIARIRVKLEASKKKINKATVQLEGFTQYDWLPLIRYDFDPKEKKKAHIHKEYKSTRHEEYFSYPSKDLIQRASEALSSLTIEQIKELIKKREEVFKKEGK